MRIRPRKTKPVDSLENLKDRVNRLFKKKPRRSNLGAQLLLTLEKPPLENKFRNHPTYSSPAQLLNFISESLPNSELYLFGGVLRDLALFGKRGFKSDIDIVVDGDWKNCSEYIQSLGATKNKFGGFRLDISGWPVDIWHAKETWAIAQGLVQYKDIRSLTKTTILNWDAILMDWKTKKIICPENYLEALRERQMDIVLQQNPNPLGAAVRVFRHLCSKDAKSITQTTAEYLAQSTEKYTYSQIKEHELSSYGNTEIEIAIYSLFKKFKEFENLEIREKFERSSRTLKMNGTSLSFQQLKLGLYEKETL